MRQISDQRLSQDKTKGERGEELFYSLFPALSKASLSQNIDHADFLMGEEGVDVKGLKRCHKLGFVLLEFTSVNGSKGWAHKDSKNKYLAFQFEDHFIVVHKADLSEWCRENMPPFPKEVTRKSKNGGSMYTELAYTYMGRKGAQDVFTYIRYDDLISIPHFYQPY